MKIVNLPGATPLETEDIEELIPVIATHEELNEHEKINIEEGLNWARTSRKLKRDLLSISGLFLLHQKMFTNVWEWAGKKRMKETNIGVPPEQIQPNLHNLCEDVKFWMESRTFSLDEIAVRFHHRLVAIHPFKNGNGRHARIAADLLLQFNQGKPFSWGSQKLTNAGEARTKYLSSLKKADNGDYKDLILFART